MNKALVKYHIERLLRFSCLNICVLLSVVPIIIGMVAAVSINPTWIRFGVAFVVAAIASIATARSVVLWFKEFDWI